MLQQKVVVKVLASTAIGIISLMFLFEDTPYKEIAVSFTHGEDYLSGVLTLPKKSEKPFPVVVFVHGDGAMPNDAYGYYRPLWSALAQRGIASYAWDKAGVGKSSGNWEAQSMEERANEVIAAIEKLQQHQDIDHNRLGLIGYSQAGWVLPLVAEKSTYPDFMVIVSGAINWLSQSDYLTKKRLARAGHSAEEIANALRANRRINQFLATDPTYDEYLKRHKQTYTGALSATNKPMNPSRFEFAKRNWHYDARDSLREIDCPILAIFGEQDQNVDIYESLKVYTEAFQHSGNKQLTTIVYPKAQHGLLKARYFREIVPGLWFIIKFELLGESAFVEGYLNEVTDWISSKTCGKSCK